MNAVQLININKTFKDKPILKDLSFVVKEGSFFGIIGKSGSGKTTILNIIGLIESFDSGELFIDEKKIEDNKREKLLLRRNKIGYLFQNFGLADDETVFWNLNICLAFSKLSKEEKKTKILNTLKQFSLDQLIDKHIYQLSGGEQQRVALVKLMLQDSDIILADEPTSSLDLENEKIIKNENNIISNKAIFLLYFNIHRVKTNPIPIIRPNAFLLLRLPVTPSPVTIVGF